MLLYLLFHLIVLCHVSRQSRAMWMCRREVINVTQCLSPNHYIYMSFSAVFSNLSIFSSGPCKFSIKSEDCIDVTLCITLKWKERNARVSERKKYVAISQSVAFWYIQLSQNWKNLTQHTVIVFFFLLFPKNQFSSHGNQLSIMRLYNTNTRNIRIDCEAT